MGIQFGLNINELIESERTAEMASPFIEGIVTDRREKRKQQKKAAKFQQDLDLRAERREDLEVLDDGTWSVAEKLAYINKGQIPDRLTDPVDALAAKMGTLEP